MSSNEPTLEEWRGFTEDRRKKVLSSWDPYSDDGKRLFEAIKEDFAKSFGHLAGIEIHGVGNCHGGLVLGVTIPFLFDKRLLPSSYLGLPVYVTVGDLPSEFAVAESSGDYVWSPQRYQTYVSRHAREIREAFKNPDMSENEMLEALIGMPFEKWVNVCREWEKQGAIPPFTLL